MSDGKISDPKDVKAFLDLVSRCDSLHDFDGKRHDDVKYVKVENKYIINILEKHSELSEKVFRALGVELNKVVPNASSDLDNILKASCTALVSCKSIGGLPATVVKRLSKVARLTRFEPRTMCFYELYAPYFQLEEITYGMGSLLTSEKIPCYDYSHKNTDETYGGYGYYTEDTGFTADQEDAKNEFQAGLCGTLNLGMTESDGRAATGLYVIPNGMTVKDKVALKDRKRELLASQLLKFFDCKNLKLLVDTSVISLGECGITDDSDKVSQICTFASEWDGAEKSACEMKELDIVASNENNAYERCIFALQELKLGKNVTVTKEDGTTYVFKNGTLPVEVSKLSTAIESVGKADTEYTNTKGQKVKFSQAEFLDFKRTGDALQVMSVKRLNEESKKDAAAKSQKVQDGNIPMQPQSLPTPDGNAHMSNGDESDNESAHSAASVKHFPPGQSRYSLHDAANRILINQIIPDNNSPPSGPPNSPGSPPLKIRRIDPSELGYSDGPASPNSTTTPTGKPLSYSTVSPANRIPLPLGGAQFGLGSARNQYGGTNDVVHAFVTVDALAFLKARLNGVPSIFTFTDFNTRERLMYLYKPEVANIHQYWKNTYKDLVTKCKIYVENYKTHTAPEQYVNFVDMVVGKATGGFFATDDASLPQWNGVLDQLKSNMETNEDALIREDQARVTFITLFRNLLISRYREISIEHLVTIFTQGFAKGKSDKLCPTNKMMSMFKGLLDAQETITALEGKISQQTRQSQHSSGKILHAAKNLGTNILKIVACTVLIEIYNKVCLFLTNFKKGAIEDIYTEIGTLTLTNVLWNERTDYSLVQQKCVKMTSFLERYNELNNLLAQPESGSILTTSIGCGIDYAMYSTLFGNIASCLSPFLHKNPNNLNGVSREIANTRVGLRHLFVGSTNREQDKIYKLMAKRVEEEMVRPICDITKSISKQIINSLYVPKIDETYRRIEIHKILMDHLKEFDDLMHLQAGGVGDLPSAGPSVASPATSEGGPSSISGIGSTPGVSLGEPSQDPYKNSPPTPTSLPPFTSEFTHPDNMYSPDELYCALMGDSITEEQFGLLSTEDKKDYHEINGKKYVHNVRLIAQQRWEQEDYLAELTDFAMFTDPELLLRINTAIIADKFTNSEKTPFIDEQTYVDRTSMEYITSSVNKYIEDNTEIMKPILETQLFVHNIIKKQVEAITTPVNDESFDESLLNILVSVLGPELTNMRVDEDQEIKESNMQVDEAQEIRDEFNAILEYYRFLYTKYNPFEATSATGGHKTVSWTLEDYHRKYYPPYAKLYYDV